MTPFIPPVRLYRPAGPDKVAMVSVAPASAPGQFLVHVARGPKSGKLGKGMAYGPYPADVVQARFDEAVAALLAEGFQRSGGQLLAAQLDDSSSKVRARAAIRLGWMRAAWAVDPLLGALPDAVDDVCSIIDALGEIGDPKAIPALRPHAARKLLSRRRSAVEALRKLGDAEGLAEARKRGLERLSNEVKAALVATNEQDPNDSSALVKALLDVPPDKRGLMLDTLYEQGTPATVEAVLKALESAPIGVPGMWRYAKSILKRAMLRHDLVTFGQLAHRIDRADREEKGQVAVVKSGYDGEQHKVHLFSRRTRKFIQRMTWRHLRKLAKWRPDAYAIAAAEALLPYAPDDARKPKGLYGSWAASYLLHQILWRRSDRFAFDARTMKFKFRSAKVTEAPAGVREEAYPELWDAHPEAYLRLLARSKLPIVHAFAHAAVKRSHPTLVQSATPEDLRRMLDAPFEGTVSLALAELSRRFDPSNPDWELLSQMLVSERDAARDLAVTWLRLSAHVWTRDAAKVLALLAHPDAKIRAAAAELAVPGVRGAPAEVREALAEKIAAAIAGKESVEGEHDRYVALATQALADELNRRIALDLLVELVSSGSLGAKVIAGALLGRRPEALAHLGLDRVLALADHEVAAVRAGAVALLGGAAEQLKSDPKLLFALAERQWPDVRAAALRLLRELDFAKLGMDAIVGLCDSSHEDVQELGKQLVLQHLGALDPQELLFRLSQHPHNNIRRFALELVRKHLRDGFIPLAKLEQLCRTILMDLWPERAMKRGVLELLAERGTKDEHQAELAASVLRDYVRTGVKQDFEPALQALVRIKLAFPQVDAGVSVPEAEGPGASS